jgi:DNA uptake protein ComE-like DNA-binding protein
VRGTALGSTGRYIDVLVAKGSTFATLTVKDCNLNGGNTMYWRNGTVWAAVVPQSYSAGCATATLSSTSSPTIAQLTGTVFAVAYTPKARIGAVRVSGTKVTVAIKCSGKAKSVCKVTLELLANNKHKKLVVVGTASPSLTAGKHKTAAVSLNTAGKRLLAAAHKLKATLIAVQVGAVVAHHTVTFKASKAKG